MNYIAGAILFHSGSDIDPAFDLLMKIANQFSFESMFDQEMSGFHKILK